MRALATLTLGLLLTACSTTTPPADIAWQQQREQLLGLTQWRANGKVALRSSRGADSASMLWRQQHANSDIRLSGPLGVGATRIQLDAEQIRVTRNGHSEHYSVQQATQLFGELDVALPVAALPYWLRGLPHPATPAQRTLIDGGLLRELEQDDWLVEYERFAVFEHHNLPTRLRLTQGDYQARFVIKRWSELQP